VIKALLAGEQIDSQVTKITSDRKLGHPVTSPAGVTLVAEVNISL
jgi:hypothetical protein